MIDKEELIESVRERVPLWDQQDKDYHNRNLRLRLWEEVGKELNIEGDEARKKWELMRDKLRRKLKESAAVQSKWCYFDQMAFLIPMMKSKRFSSHHLVSDQTTPQDSEEYGEVPHAETYYIDSTEIDEKFDEPEEVTEIDIAQHFGNSYSISSECAGSKRKRDPSIQNDDLNLERSKFRVLKAGFEESEPSSAEEDDDLIFFRSLLPSLKRLPLIRRMKLRSTFLNCVIDELEKAESTNRTMPSPTRTIYNQPSSSSARFSVKSCGSYTQGTTSHIDILSCLNNEMKPFSAPSPSYDHTTFDNI